MGLSSSLTPAEQAGPPFPTAVTGWGAHGLDPFYGGARDGSSHTPWDTGNIPLQETRTEVAGEKPIRSRTPLGNATRTRPQSTLQAHGRALMHGSRVGGERVVPWWLSR